jgi:Cell Wall Hydrolase
VIGLAADPLFDLLARTIQVEAAYGPARGFDAVGASIVNRVDGKSPVSLEQVCLALPCWIARADGRVPALTAPRNGRSFEQAQRVAGEILRGRLVDPTLGATEWLEAEDGNPPLKCPRVRIGGRWYFDPKARRRRR